MGIMRVALILSLFAVFGSRSVAADTQSWSGSMQGMLQPVLDLVPYVYDQKKFVDPANEGAIKTRIEGFSRAVHKVPPGLGRQVMGKDPVIQYTLGRLKEDVQRAQKHYQSGHKDYARNMLRGTLEHCFSCHSRTQIGPELRLSDSALSSMELEPTDKADVYLATRQYDRALDLLTHTLARPVTSYKDPLEPERVLRKYLAITVRVKHDPEAALSTIDNFLKQPDLYYGLEQNARNWRRSLQDWLNEKKIDVAPLIKAQQLIERAKQQESLSSEMAGDIEYLRASALLYDALKKEQNKQQRATIYSLLGQCHENLFGLWSWDLAEIYNEACIKEWPRSGVAKACYRAFEDNLVLGFTGSAGTFIPPEEKTRLKELARLAGF